ncbi:hypothetical protein M514_28223 [Trichuris suis]|uniref:Uncharacterized protein n=1 Tax=Trichuris suis TaxID=68888 RepID=A0A085MQV1_9BILA|nr:hypothetical protein M514_28223 [Trichuris suis]
MEKSLDLRLIPEYDGTARQSIAEWLEKVELVCKLRGIDNIADVIPLRLTDGAFAVYLHILKIHEAVYIWWLQRAGVLVRSRH